MDYPNLRPIEAFPVEVENRQRIYIRDPLNYAKDSLLLSYPTYFIISHFDGRHSTLDIQEAFVRQFGDILSSDKIRELAEQLDQYYYLDSERFARLQQEILDAFRRSPVREMGPGRDLARLVEAGAELQVRPQPTERLGAELAFVRVGGLLRIEPLARRGEHRRTGRLAAMAPGLVVGQVGLRGESARVQTGRGDGNNAKHDWIPPFGSLEPP